MTVQFIDLPQELLTQILSNLPPKQLVFPIQLVNHYLRDLVQTSSAPQYQMATAFAGLQDDPKSTLVPVERLEALRSYENAWQNFAVKKHQQIQVMHRTSGLYDLSQGIYILGEYIGGVLEYPTAVLRWVDLNQDEPNWQSICVDRNIVDFGIAVKEHDLIALVTSRPKSSRGVTAVTELVLLNISTGQHHVMTTQPVIHVTETMVLQGHCSVMLEIVGDHLALLLTYEDHPDEIGGTHNDTFYLYDWRSGTLEFKMDAGQNKYQGFIFLSEDAILFPNIRDSRLELFTLYNNQLNHRCSLNLPELAPNHDIIMLTCRAEPNPTGSSSKTKPKPHSKLKPTQVRDSAMPPFAANPDDAIALFNLLIMNRVIWEQRFFSFLIHRSSLLKFLEPHSEIEKESDTDDMEIDVSPVSIPWHSWGPSTTRWLNGDSIAHGYITITAGQRYVSIPSNSPVDTSPISVLDFNPYNVARFAAEQDTSEPEGGIEQKEGKGAQPTPGQATRKLVRDSGQLQQQIFAEIVYSSLPYIETTSAGSYDYTAVLMDEERILGLRQFMGPLSRTIRQVDVLHMT